MSIKTFGDLIRIKRYEKRFTLWQLAQKMGIATVEIRTWEKDLNQPDQQNRERLALILDFEVESCGQF